METETHRCAERESIRMDARLFEREMTTVIREAASSWRNVTSGVPQGLVLAPIMFQIYVNDMQYGVTSYMNLFADDAKLMRLLRTLMIVENYKGI